MDDQDIGKEKELDGINIHKISNGSDILTACPFFKLNHAPLPGGAVDLHACSFRFRLCNEK
jgi:hypothetical protein